MGSGGIPGLPFVGVFAGFLGFMFALQRGGGFSKTFEGGSWRAALFSLTAGSDFRRPSGEAPGGRRFFRLQRWGFPKTFGGCPSGRDSEDRGGGRSVFRRQSVPPPLPSERDLPPLLPYLAWEALSRVGLYLNVDRRKRSNGAALEQTIWNL